MPKNLKQITTKELEQFDLKQFIDWAYTVSGIAKSDLKPYNIFKSYFSFVQETECPLDTIKAELEKEFIQIGIESKGKVHGFGNDAR